MTNSSLAASFPEKTCEIDRLVNSPRLKKAALVGIKTQQRRDGLYAYPNEEFLIDDVVFVVTGVERKLLGDMNDADAKAEGFEDLASYKKLILSMHKGMEWHSESKVWVHSFEKKG